MENTTNTKAPASPPLPAPAGSAAGRELARRMEYCGPVFEALQAEVAAGRYSNALAHAEPLIRELKLCEHDCRCLVEMRKRHNSMFGTKSQV